MLLRWGKDDPEILNSSLEISSKEADRLIMLCNELLHLTREMKVKCKEAINIIPIINHIRAVIARINNSNMIILAIGVITSSAIVYILPIISR